jgi:hypothetical protein
MAQAGRSNGVERRSNPPTGLDRTGGVSGVLGHPVRPRETFTSPQWLPVLTV